VAVFRVDKRTGRLEFTGHFAAVGNPSAVAFVELKGG
jgi:6-phosphogluconolactonase (cycloisomerase 2 family)